MKTPCNKDCKDRRPTCHAHCDKYKAWCEQETARKAELREIKNKATIIDLP